MVFRDSDTSVLISCETGAYGTRVTPAKDVGLVQNITMTERNTLEKVNVVGARNASTLSAGKYDATGSIETIFQHGRLLAYAVGTVAHSNSSTPDILHTFAEADNLSSFSLQNGHSGSTSVGMEYYGCKVNQLTIALEQGGQLTQRAEILAKTSSNNAVATAVSISSLTTLPAWSAELKEGGTTVAKVRTFEWTINNNLIPTGAVGARLIQQAVEGNRDYTMRVSLAFENRTQYSNFLGGNYPSTGNPTANAYVLNCSRGTLATNWRQLYISTSNCLYESASTPVTYGGVTYQDFDVIGLSGTTGNVYTYDNLTSATW